MRRHLRRIPSSGSLTLFGGNVKPSRERRSANRLMSMPAGIIEALPLDADARVVVDASVVSKWFVPEPHSDAARRLLGGGYRIYLPDLVFSELGAILERRVAADLISDTEALSVLQVLSKMPLQIHRTWQLGPIALELKRSLDRTVHDCIHMALALREGAILVTADRRLYETLRETVLARYICWIEDIPQHAAN